MIKRTTLGDKIGAHDNHLAFTIQSHDLKTHLTYQYPLKSSNTKDPYNHYYHSQNLMGTCPTHFSGKSCDWTFNSDCSSTACTQNTTSWLTFQQCYQHCCKASSNTYRSIYKCDKDFTPMIVGIFLGIVYPLTGAVLFCLFANKEDKKWKKCIVTTLFWPFLLIGLIGSSVLKCAKQYCCHDLQCDTDFFDDKFCSSQNLDCRLLIVIPVMVVFCIATFLGFVADGLLVVASLGLVLCTGYKSSGKRILKKWKQWIKKRKTNQIEVQSQ